jgi:hypothetical protein
MLLLLTPPHVRLVEQRNAARAVLRTTDIDILSMPGQGDGSVYWCEKKKVGGKRRYITTGKCMHLTHRRELAFHLPTPIVFLSDSEDGVNTDRAAIPTVVWGKKEGEVRLSATNATEPISHWHHWPPQPLGH